MICTADMATIRHLEDMARSAKPIIVKRDSDTSFFVLMPADLAELCRAWRECAGVVIKPDAIDLRPIAVTGGVR